MLKKILHIGLIVKDLDQAVKKFQDILQLECKEIKKSDEIGIAVFPIGESSLELLQFTSKQEEFQKAIEGAREGMHHICFEVDNLEKSIKELTKRGLTLVKGFPTRGIHGEVAFFEPRALGKMLVEICELKEASS